MNSRSLPATSWAAESPAFLHTPSAHSKQVRSHSFISGTNILMEVINGGLNSSVAVDEEWLQVLLVTMATRVDLFH